MKVWVFSNWKRELATTGRLVVFRDRTATRLSKLKPLTIAKAKRKRK